MKKHFERIFALVVILCVICSTILPSISFAAGQPSRYSSSANSGERDVICTTLDGTTAAGYYTGSNSYDSLSALSKNELLQSLRTLMTSTHKTLTSYANCRDYANITDCENGNTNMISTIYTSYETSHSQYNGGNGWNREHVWPKSLGGFNQDGAGSDLHHIRPSENKTNSDRGNKKYGEVTGGTTSKGNLSGLVGGSYSGYYEPLDNVKGDVARICLYVYVRWGATYSQSNNITNVFESVDVLLNWCKLDPVDTWEMGRNEVVYAKQGNRNVFIDYPEYAWLIFGRSVPTDMQTPSGKASGGNAGGNVGGGDIGGGDIGGGDVGGDTTNQPKVDETPNASTPYKFGMVQGNLGATYYLAGGMDGYYMQTTTDYSSAIDVYLEPTTNGYYLYTKSGNTKTYINMVVSSDGQHVNGVYESSAKTVYTIDPTLKSVVAVVDGATYHFGTRNDRTYNTVGPCKTSYNGFNCQFYAMEEKCAHDNKVLKGEVSATCGENGYTGDTYCADCNELLTKGSDIPATENHDFGAWENLDAMTQKRACLECGETETRVNPAIGCTHTETEKRGATDATCSEFGYTGDECCTVCDTVVMKGTKIPYTDHTYGEDEVITEPTEEKNGLSKKVCTGCGDELVDIIPKLTAPKNNGAGATVVIVISSVLGVGVIGGVIFFIKRKISG